MKYKNTAATFRSLALLVSALLILCALPAAALADDAPTPVDSDTALEAALADSAVTSIVLLNDIATPLTQISKSINLAGFTLSVPDGTEFNGTIANGAIAAAYAVNNGGMSKLAFSGVLYDYTNSVSGTGGSVFYVWRINMPAGGTPRSVGGVAVTHISGDNYWVPSGSCPVTVVTGTDGRSYLLSSGGYYAEYTISYYYNNNADVSKCTKMTLKGAYPTTYTADKATKIKAAPDQTGYAFKYWSWGSVQGTTITIPAGTTGDIKVYSNWGEAVTSATSGGAATQNGSATGNMGGGGMSAAAGAAAAAGDSETDDDDDKTVAQTTTPQGGMRVRTASSVSRHAFSDTQSSEAIEAMAGRRQGARFPWQWVGLGLGGALILLAVLLTVRRRLRERNAATLEKLHIHDG